MVNPDRIAKILLPIKMLRYFPSEPEVYAELVRIVCEMCSEQPAKAEEQARWLAHAMNGGAFTDWPGPREFRALFCSKYRPRDGNEVFSDLYPEGNYPNLPKSALSPPSPLPPGRVATANPKLDAAVRTLAVVKALPSVSKP